MSNIFSTTTRPPISPISSSSNIPSQIPSFIQTQHTNSEDDPDYLHLIFETSTGKIVIKCKLCDNYFDNLPLFNSHVKFKHKYRNLCRVCYKVFYSKKQQKAHMREVHGKLFACEYCKGKYWDYLGLIDHIKSSHPGKELPPASIRSDLNLYGTPTDSNMASIYTTVTDTTFATDAADAADATDAVTTRTTFRSETQQSINGSSHKTKKITTQTNNDNNAVFIHEIIYDIMLKCNICEDIFISNKEFNKHAKLEHEIKHLCFNCSRVFEDKKLYGKHINTEHARYCSYCEKRYNIEKNLEKHILKSHLQGDETNDDSREVDHEENLAITDGDDAFFLHETLQSSSGTVIRCKECEKTFNCLTIFRHHAKYTHKHEWLCLVCCLVFSTGKTRGKHMRKNHTRDFLCTLCSKKCYDKSGLREHFRAKHPSEKFPRMSTLPQSQVSFIHEIIPHQFPLGKKCPYQLKCQICEEIFDNHLRFNKHAKDLHDCESLCSLCSRISSQKELIKENARLDICKVCKMDYRGENLMKDDKHDDDKTKHDDQINLSDQMNISSHQEETESYEPIAARLRSKKRKISEMKNISSEDEGDDEKDIMEVDKNSFFYDTEEGNERSNYYDDRASKEHSQQTFISLETSSTSQTAITQVSFIHEFIPCEHSDEEIFQLKCKICEGIFDDHGQFNKHAKVLHLFKLLCPVCSRIFTREDLKRKHMAQDHAVECVCGKKFCNERSLMNHCKSKNHPYNQGETNRLEKCARQDYYVACQVCEKKFGDAKGLMNHCQAKRHHQNNINSHQEETAYPTLSRSKEIESSTPYEPIASRLRSKENMKNVSYDGNLLYDDNVDDEYGMYDSMEEEDEPEITFKKFRKEEDSDSFFDDYFTEEECDTLF